MRTLPNWRPESSGLEGSTPCKQDTKQKKYTNNKHWREHEEKGTLYSVGGKDKLK